jgi:hypothetical protein
MTPTQVALLSIQIGLVLVGMSFLVGWLIRAKQEKYKYKLYAIRDELIYLVATEELAESSMVFKVLYSTINQTISEVHDVDRWSFIRASTRARSALEHAEIEVLVREICSAPRPVINTALAFFDTMQYIVKANSPLTKFCIGCLRLFRNRSAGLSRWLELFLPKEQYETYRYFRHLSAECHP